MSELKWSWVYYPYLDPPEKQKESALKAGYTKVYLKSEADKVIAELKDNLQAADKQIENLINSASSIMLLQDRVNDNICAESRHHKYKRCSAMVKYCEYRFKNLEKMIDTEYRTKKMRFSHRWWVKWLKLADKFKENIK